MKDDRWTVRSTGWQIKGVGPLEDINVVEEMTLCGNREWYGGGQQWTENVGGFWGMAIYCSGRIQSRIEKKRTNTSTSTVFLLPTYMTYFCLQLKDMNSALNCYCYFFTARRFRSGVFDLLTFGGRIKVKCLRNDSDKVKSMATDSSGVSRSNTGPQPSA